VPNPARADLAGRDANRAAHSRPETKRARPELAGRTLPAPSQANARSAADDVPRDVRSGLREGLRQGLRPWMEPSPPSEPARQVPKEGSAASADSRG
jgi:hypothetical protein